MKDTTIPASITELDKDLSLIREAMTAATPDKKPRWSRIMDNALEERSRLMKLRDAKPAVPA